jgi:hypothetical protein
MAQYGKVPINPEQVVFVPFEDREITVRVEDQTISVDPEIRYILCS